MRPKDGQEEGRALFEAGSLLVGGGSAAELVEMYRRHVAANATRLGHARALTEGKSRKCSDPLGTFVPAAT